MKGNFLIIASGITLVLLLALWLYLLFFNNPRSANEIFTDFGFGGADVNVEPLPEPIVAPEEEPVVDIGGEGAPLRQLTTRPVIGFREIMITASDTPLIFYAESGTGHLYTIDTQTGAEQKISATTIADAKRAEFTSDGRFVVIQAGTGNSKRTMIGEIDAESESITTKDIPDTVEDFSITRNNELLFSVVTDSGVNGKVLTINDLGSRTIFTIPFREATVIWGEQATDAHYLYPKPSSMLEGFLYEIKNGLLRRLPASGYGFAATGHEGTIGYNTHDGRVTTGKILFANTNTTIDSPVLFLPEKCAFSTASSSLWWCAHEVGVQDHTFPDKWYMGLQSFSDMIWRVVLVNNSYEMYPLIDTLSATSRNVDIVDIMANDNETALYFKNKNDNTLWLYEI